MQTQARPESKPHTESHPPADGFFKTRPVSLRLKGGTTFEGLAPDYQKNAAAGEVVFSTGMVGYVESLTDPSYAGQILTFTYPLIGNYGVPDPSAWEATRIHARGVVISEPSIEYSHRTAERSFLEWLRAQDVPVIWDIDTRALTRTLREHGTMLGAITSPRATRPSYWDPNKVDLVSEVSPREPVTIKPTGRSKKTAILIDCGAKENIVRSLSNESVTVRRVPNDYDFTKEDYDGVFISNGPGNPAMAKSAIEVIKRALRRTKPVFGICLGNQLLALAAGANTHKLPYGHRGHNQPVRDERTGRCYITSQNHGYAVSEPLPPGWIVTHRNLNDGSVEGIAHQNLPFAAVQFHPEAAPGPVDSAGLFKTFVSSL